MSNDLVQQKANTLRKLLEISKKEIEAALPKHLTPDRMLRIALTEARKNPALLDCTQTSFMGAIIQCAQLGLEPGSSLGHAYLVPFKNKKAGTVEVQFIIGYRGMLDLAGRSERCSHVIARAVYDSDEFQYEFGLNEKLNHKPKPGDGKEKLTHAYAIITLKDGSKLFDVMMRSELEAARERSKSSEDGPWVSDYEAMCKKTVVRRLFKFAPVSIEIQNAVGLDEAAERGEQFNGMVIDAEGKTIPENNPVNNVVDALKKSTEVKTKHIETEGEKKGNEQYKKEVDESTVDFMNAPEPRNRTEISKSIIEIAKELKRPLSEVGDQAQKLFKKPLDKCTEAELERIENSLASELRGK